MDGPDRPTMGNSQNHPAGRPSQGRSPRSSLERTAQGIKWSIVDSAHRSALARPAREVRTVPNGAPTIPELGTFWSDRKDTAGPGRAPQGGRGLDLKECFVDGTFVPAKKGGAASGKPSAGRVPRSWALQTAMVFLSPCGQKVLRQLK